MELELVPIEGEKLLSPKEREQMLKRIREIPPDAFKHLSDADRHAIKTFLYHDISLSLLLHNDMEDKEHLSDHREHMQKVHATRQKLFDSIPPVVHEFCQLVDISPMEPWLEWDVLLKSLMSEKHTQYYKTKNESGVAANLNNPFLMKIDDDIEDKHYDEMMKTKITPHEIEELIFHFSVEEIVGLIIRARKVITGTFWARDYDF